ncbi:hypothetical protein AUJ14_04250 [Candidatus Micrarchaeota archaeon CG1_02_55_22]|nr:MAG: hypothetical protein AUJ14_04250 [Candidatus Micrarchaeota archaeon CG1_02_55_22]
MTRPLATVGGLVHGAIDELSRRQRQALHLAVQYGYYDTPKRSDIALLAKKMGVDEATFSEHLRKVESKVLPPLALLLTGSRI